MSSAGRAASSSGCVGGPRGRETGLTGYAEQIQRSLPTGSSAMEPAEHREPYESRGSRTDLGAPGGESPPGDSTESAVPSTTEHSRSAFKYGRTVTLPSRPEVAEPQNRKLEAVNRRRTETPSKTALFRGCCSKIAEQRRNMRPNAQLFRKRRAHEHQVPGSRALQAAQLLQCQ